MKAHIIISYSDGGSAFGHSLRLPHAETAIPHALKPSFNGTPIQMNAVEMLARGKAKAISVVPHAWNWPYFRKIAFWL